jgi:hypothetical protein
MAIVSTGVDLGVGAHVSTSAACVLKLAQCRRDVLVRLVVVAVLKTAVVLPGLALERAGVGGVGGSIIGGWVAVWVGGGGCCRVWVFGGGR